MEFPLLHFTWEGKLSFGLGTLTDRGWLAILESFIRKLKYQFLKEIQEEQEEIQKLCEANYQFWKVIQEVKEMQEEEEANQKVQQQILRRRQIDEELCQAMDKLCECFSKGDNCVVNSQDVAQEDAFEIPNSMKNNDQQPVTRKLAGQCSWAYAI